MAADIFCDRQAVVRCSWGSSSSSCPTPRSKLNNVSWSSERDIVHVQLDFVLADNKYLIRLAPYTGTAGFFGTGLSITETESLSCNRSQKVAQDGSEARPTKGYSNAGTLVCHDCGVYLDLHALYHVRTFLDRKASHTAVNAHRKHAAA